MNLRLELLGYVLTLEPYEACEDAASVRPTEAKIPAATLHPYATGGNYREMTPEEYLAEYGGSPPVGSHLIIKHSSNPDTEAEHRRAR